MNRITGKNGKALIKSIEGCSLTAYKDQANVWTIGYGSTFGVKQSMTITQSDAENRIIIDLMSAESVINKLVSAPLYGNQFDALVAFVYNVGQKAFADSTLLRLLNIGEYHKVPDQLRRWTKVNKIENAGLRNRREKEIRLWCCHDNFPYMS